MGDSQRILPTHPVPHLSYLQHSLLNNSTNSSPAQTLYLMTMEESMTLMLNVKCLPNCSKLPCKSVRLEMHYPKYLSCGYLDN